MTHPVEANSPHPANVRETPSLTVEESTNTNRSNSAAKRSKSSLVTSVKQLFRPKSPDKSHQTSNDSHSASLRPTAGSSKKEPNIGIATDHSPHTLINQPAPPPASEPSPGNTPNRPSSPSAAQHSPRTLPSQQALPSLANASVNTARSPAPVSYPNINYPTPTVIATGKGIEKNSLNEVASVTNPAPASNAVVRCDDSTSNIIVFGESGVGKSSLINMIIGTDSAATSNEAIGCTFQSAPYDAVLDGCKYRIWDTIGLNEGERGTASPDISIQNLHRLVLNLQHEGVNLLVYCIRGSRIRDIIKVNYDLFWKIICNEQVPIALVITGLENEEEMEDWWRNNHRDFAARGMEFGGHACVTTIKGKRMKNGEYMYEAEFNHSVQVVRELIVKCCPKRPWKPDNSRWLIDIVQTMRQMFLQNEAQSRLSDDAYGYRSQARSEYAVPGALGQFLASMAMALSEGRS